MKKRFTIIGAGLAGISASYHLGHDQCVIFEWKDHAFGHIHSDQINGFTWDEGPHVSFTRNEYVRGLFEKTTEGNYVEQSVQPVNYYYGDWIDHPVQSNLYAVLEPLRSSCLQDMIKAREQFTGEYQPANYREWLEAAFGKSLTSHFSERYTKKYWTVESRQLHTNWVGNRIFYPDLKTVMDGFVQKPEFSTHYITSIRYPTRGGYQSFAVILFEGSETFFNHEVSRVDLGKNLVYFKNGKVHEYDNLIVTMPLPEFIECCDAPQQVRVAASQLRCSELLLVNVEVNHPAVRPEPWLYVYDEDKYATRINFTEALSPNNAPAGMNGIQVEVYFSKYKPQEVPDEEIAKKVLDELLQMGLINSRENIVNFHSKRIKYANVIFDLHYKDHLNTVLDWLQSYGLKREADDLEPMTNWEHKQSGIEPLGPLILAGRFGQWKYFWTDDCVLRGRYLSKSLSERPA